jgi:urease accessory protein UreF
MNVLGLVQLCESVGPMGGYREFLELERSARMGAIRSGDDLREFVGTALRAGIGPADGVASGIAFRAARNGSIEPLPAVCAALSSERVPAEKRWASVQMGHHLWAQSRAWGWTEGVHQQLDALALRNDLHHAVAFGALVSETTSSQIRAIATYLFNMAKTLVMAGVRLIPLDEAAGQQVLSSVQGEIATLAAGYVDKGPGDILVIRN